MLLSVISPIHNEEGCLDEFIQRAVTTLENHFSGSWEMHLIDDASHDRSLSILYAHAKNNSNIHVHHHPTRKGQAGCFTTGFQSAKGDIAITIDSDLQVFPEDIPLLVKGIQKGYDLANAVRMNRQHPRIIRFASKLYNTLVKIVFDSKVDDAASNFTAIKHSYVANLTLIENDHRYIIPITCHRGLKKIYQVPVRHQKRLTGQAKYGFQKALTGFPELIRFWVRLQQGFYNLKAEA